MRASVSPGKITHTHSQWRGTNAGYSPPLLNIWLERNDLSSPPSWLAVTDPGTFDTCPRVSVHTHTLPYTCMCGQKRKKPSATYWLGLELGEFWPLSHDNLPDLHQDLQKGRGVRAKPPHKTTRTQKPSCRSSESSFHHWGKIACVLTSRRHVCAQKCARASVFFLVPDTCSHQGWVTSKHLIYALQTLSCRMRSQRTLGANSSQSNKL